VYVLAAARHRVVKAKFRVVVVIGDYNMARIGKRVIVIVIDIIALRLLLTVRRIAALNWWFLGQWL
jgi:hypothetical protein